MRAFATQALAVLPVSGCSRSLQASNYDQACTTELDCMPVREGDACLPCGCPDAAIRADEGERCASDSAAVQPFCGPPVKLACGPCEETTVACIQSRCALQ